MVNVFAVINGTCLASHPIAAYRCPDEPSPSGHTGMTATTSASADSWAASNYAANYLVFGNPTAPYNAALQTYGSTEGATTIAAIRDGTLNTIFFTERYATCSLVGVANSSATYGNLWADSNTTWRPQFCMNGQTPPAPLPQPQTTPPLTGNWPPCLPFQTAPDWLTGCDSSRAQSPHAGGIQVCLGDGSVRFAAQGISDVAWAYLCDPRDGNSLGNDW